MTPFSIFRPLYRPITLQEAREKELLQAQFALLLAQSDLDHARATVSYNEARVGRLVLVITEASVLSAPPNPRHKSWPRPPILSA
jgi:hypothetical protein